MQTIRWMEKSFVSTEAIKKYKIKNDQNGRLNKTKKNNGLGNIWITDDRGVVSATLKKFLFKIRRGSSPQKTNGCEQIIYRKGNLGSKYMEKHFKVT